MRNFVLFVAAATLIGGSSLAIAQDRDNHGGPQGGPPHPGPAAAAHPGPAPHGGPAPHAGPAPHVGPAPHSAPVHAQNNGQNNFHASNNAPQRAQAAPAAAPAMRAAPNNANPNVMRANRGNNAQPASNAMRGNANRGNAPQRNSSTVRNFHQNFNASRRFHAAPYRQPRGFYVHHWTWGETLPSIFWARDYWLNDFADYDLPPPPPGAVWVRVGADALLIDAESGEIIEVDYGVFY